ncbi:ASC domain containing protein [Asbolus verrucosus]|uniref:ASC domain containing protein n=1 Tax=Asbolus verrucosus TaxID=1661398 RepID=A0A482VZT8_ASBVE|nr:ASC domain containing protein [Asbolus verrucosus]
MSNKCTSIRNYFREYCSRSSVHGFQYIGEKKRPIFERIWWFFVFAICLSGCAFSIYTVYKKWEQSPVIVNLANSGTPIYKIPFPAVTICPESKSAEDIFNYTDVMLKKERGELLDPLEDTRFEYMSLICNHDPNLRLSNNETFPEEFFDVVDDIKPKFYLENCLFMTVSDDCSSFFFPILTSEGICYTGNMLDRSEIFKENVVHYKNYHQTNSSGENWTLEDGYAKEAGLNVYPIRALASGAMNGLNFVINTPKKNRDFACKNSIQGYRVALHSPTTIPWPSQKFFRIPLHQSVTATIQPTRITISDRIKTYSPKHRNCYFANERPLRYFQKYTFSNCKLECLTNYTLMMCHCVNFFMPSRWKAKLTRIVSGDNTTEICGTGKIKCMKSAECKFLIFISRKSNFSNSVVLMQAAYLLRNLKTLDNFTYEDLKKSQMDLKCYCLPICSDLYYDAKITQTDWDWNSWLGFRRNSTELRELMLSLMEILYFLSVRLICNKRLFGRWTGPED